MGKLNPYVRLTSTDAYSVGRDLIAYLHTLFQNKNIPFGDFVRDYAQENKFKTVTTQSFQADMEKSFNGSLQPLFDNYVYGRSQKRGLGDSQKSPQNPKHRKLTLEEL